MQRRLEQGIIGLAHNVLPKAIEAVHVVLPTPSYGLSGHESHIMAAEDLPGASVSN